MFSAETPPHPSAPVRDQPRDEPRTTEIPGESPTPEHFPEPARLLARTASADRELRLRAAVGLPGGLWQAGAER
ncbi:hypothetical protein [Kitasatospora sp. NPDC097643]|uniref:hypothetical protein n=1 Tax=Kitasatospora sp. NPDC097643 TaxID=3157230 RepID=UPI0033328F2F